MLNRTQVKLIIFDVDGTLTDGHIYITSRGELFKSFYVRDGYAIKYMLPSAGISAAIITGRTSKIVEQRAFELGIPYVYQEITDKVKTASGLIKQLKLQWGQVAAIGDDLNDISLLKLVGASGCPADAALEVREICDYICKAEGGYGAVREFIDWLLRLDRG